MLRAPARELLAAAEDRQPGALRALARRIFEAERDADRAGPVLDALSSASPRTWLWLDSALRGWWWPCEEGWRPYEEREQRAEGTANPLATLVMACSGNGHERERAISSQAMREDARLLPVLVIRTADWVRHVRGKAREVLDGVLAAAGPNELLTATRIATEMRAQVRASHAVSAVTQALRDDPAALAAARDCGHGASRRLACRIWLEHGQADWADVAAAASAGADNVCQGMCAQAVTDHAVRAGEPALLESVLAEGGARVRVIALTGLVKLGRPQAGQRFLADRSAMLRATAQWAVRRAGDDPAVICRARLGDGTGPVRGLVAGLGECGDRADVERLAAFLGHAQPRVRAEAVRAVRRLGGGLARISRMLTDPAPIVVRAARRALRADPGVVLTERLWELLGTDQPRHVRIAAYRLLRDRGTWIRVHACLHLVTARDAELSGYAHADLVTWLGGDAATSYAAPPAETRERILTLLEDAGPALEPETARRLRWHIAHTR